VITWPAGWAQAFAAALFVAGLAATAPAVRAPLAPAPVAGPCGQWYATASSVGWADEQWPTVARIMACESGCDPGAHNRSGASGLLQIMPGWWAGRDPYDPTTNLTMGLEVFRAQGWHAWSCH